MDKKQTSSCSVFTRDSAGSTTIDDSPLSPASSSSSSSSSVASFRQQTSSPTPSSTGSAGGGGGAGATAYIIQSKSSNGRKSTVKVEDGDDANSVTCFCRKPFAGRPMVECDSCATWFHLSCVKMKKSAIPDVWNCLACQEKRANKQKEKRLSK